MIYVKYCATASTTSWAFMVVGIGIGTELAINGAVAHAFVHILYKALLFMSMGAVLYRTGTIRASDLGGLYRSMPWTTAFCIVGAMSISAFPLFSGFVAKSLTMSAVIEGYYVFIFIGLLIASAGLWSIQVSRFRTLHFSDMIPGFDVRKHPFTCAWLWA
ncbi:MAG: hypothetical protein Ct9H300mP14_08440 [Gammaproteobacteria bacterium]|nr:MAG: hypothetical protein Ct9H300mP14_08440 [Gammaproteobacteria bacterium]